jgi:hypothetical protein
LFRFLAKPPSGFAPPHFVHVFTASILGVKFSDMRPSEIEEWTLAVIDRVISGRPVEDARVELKAEWPADHRKAARRIAGHANAAHGEPILWLIGVDEKARTVPGVDAIDFADWFAKVKSSFNELAPSLIDIVVPSHGRTVVALLFATDRAPYVVTNPDGGAFQRDVPWREGTAVASATREQLFRILAPAARTPHLSIRQANLQIQNEERSGGNKWRQRWTGEFVFFAEQPQDQHAVIARRTTTVEVFHGDSKISQQLVESFVPKGPDVGKPGSVLNLVGPQYFYAKSVVDVTLDHEPTIPTGPLRVAVTFKIPNCDRDVMCEATLQHFASGTRLRQAWIKDPRHMPSADY